jgi:hypothetical protein
MKKLFDTTTQKVLDYPRSDDLPVQGLEARYKVLTVVDTAPPTTTANQILSFTYQVLEADLEYRQVWTVNERPAIVRSIDMRRLRLALLQMNLLDSIDAAIAAQPKAAQIEWEFATDVKTSHPLVAQIATAMGLDINAIFDLAETFT